MKNLFLLILAFTLSCCSRSSEDSSSQDQLPPATQTGANTAGCLVNGKVLIPKNGSQNIGGQPLYGLNLYKGNNFWPNKDDYWQLEIADKKNTNSIGVIIWLKTLITGNGDYIVGQSNGDLYTNGPLNPQIIAGITENGVNKIYYSSSNSGTIKITRSDLSTGISIYSGTFSATLYNKDNPSDKIQITEGRFDINNLTLNK